MLQRAYHWDVIVVKEALFHATVKTDATSMSTYINEESKLANLHQLLQTVPPANIRPLMASFDLFAPAQCELRCKPFNHCGGMLEIVHKECELFQMLNKHPFDLYIWVDYLQQEVHRCTPLVQYPSLICFHFLLKKSPRSLHSWYQLRSRPYKDDWTLSLRRWRLQISLWEWSKG